MTVSNDKQWPRLLSIVVLSVWLCFLGTIIWNQVRRTHEPPVYDSIGYFAKARNFWANLYQKRIKNPLNLDPNFRPPGTVLMSYPFGFTADYHGFLFRSVFFPAALLAIAVLAAGEFRNKPAKQWWNLVLLAIFLSTLPSPFHFEFRDADPAGYFGLVDDFLMGVAALAAGLLLHSARTKLLRWTVAGALVSTLCILIKPAGAIIMALLAVCWSIAVLTGSRAPGPDNCRRHDFRFFLRGALLIALIEVPVVVECRRSLYLSATTILEGKIMMKMMHGELGFHPSPAFIHAMFRVSVGYPILAMMVLLLLLLIFYRTVLKEQIRFLLPAALTLMAGFWFWIIETAGTQVRFFVPFAAMTFIWLVPAILQVAEQLPQWGRTLLLLFWLTPAVNLGALLLQANPHPVWQYYSGVTINIGQNDALVTQAETVLTQARNQGKNLTVYALDLDSSTAVLMSVGTYQHFVDSAKPSFDVEVPINWVSPSAYHLQDMLKCRYIVFVPVLDQQEIHTQLERHSTDDFWQEYALLHSWFSTLNENDGIHVVSQTSSRLIEITDPPKFRASLAMLIKSHAWRPLFNSINSDLQDSSAP